MLISTDPQLTQYLSKFLSQISRLYIFFIDLVYNYFFFRMAYCWICTKISFGYFFSRIWYAEFFFSYLFKSLIYLFFRGSHWKMGIWCGNRQSLNSRRKVLLVLLLLLLLGDLINHWLKYRLKFKLLFAKLLQLLLICLKLLEEVCVCYYFFKTLIKFILTFLCILMNR
jgi:hypothetical protein